MHFIERLFGLAPDAGSGLLEFSLMAILLSVLPLRLALRSVVKRSATRNGSRRG